MCSQRVMWLHGWLPVIIGHHPAKFGGHRPCKRGDIMFSIWHVTSCDHVIKESRNLIFGFVSSHISTLQRLSDHTYSEEKNILFLICHVISVWVTFDFLGAFTYKQLHLPNYTTIFSHELSCPRWVVFLRYTERK